MFLNLEYREEQDCQLAGLGMFFGRYVFFGWLWILDCLIFLAVSRNAHIAQNTSSVDAVAGSHEHEPLTLRGSAYPRFWSVIQDMEQNTKKQGGYCTD
jgi:hypothetical protein